MGNLPGGKRGSSGRYRYRHLVGTAALLSGDDLSARARKERSARVYSSLRITGTTEEYQSEK